MPRDSAHPVGATGAMLKFPSALPWLLVLAVAAGVWLGRAMDGTPMPLAWGFAAGCLLIAITAWTLVQKYGEPEPH